MHPLLKGSHLGPCETFCSHVEFPNETAPPTKRNSSIMKRTQLNHANRLDGWLTKPCFIPKDACLMEWEVGFAQSKALEGHKLKKLPKAKGFLQSGETNTNQSPQPPQKALPAHTHVHCALSQVVV